MMLFDARNVKEKEELQEGLIWEVDITTCLLRLVQDVKEKVKSLVEFAVCVEDR